MAAPTPTPRPGRTLAVIALIIVALFGWIFVSGHHSPKLGIDLAGGTSLTLKPGCPAGETGTVTDDAVDQAVNIIRQRVDGLGVAESTVTRQGTGSGSTIVIEVPGKNQKDLNDKVGKTAKMSFRKLLLSCGPVRAAAGAQPAPTASPSASAGSDRVAHATPPHHERLGRAVATSPSSNGRPAAGLTAASPSPTPSASAAADGDATAADATATCAPLGTTATVAGADVARAVGGAGLHEDHQRRPPAGHRQGRPRHLLGGRHRELHPRPAGHPRLGHHRRHGGPGHRVERHRHPAVGRQPELQRRGRPASSPTPPAQLYGQTAGSDQNRFAIVLDGLVQTAPTVNGAILNGQAQISGSFTQETATDLANVLNYGALPLAFEAQQQQAISATLGLGPPVRGRRSPGSSGCCSSSCTCCCTTAGSGWSRSPAS